MTFKFLNRAQMTVSGTPGTGTITLGSPVSGFQTFAQAGIVDQDTFPYIVVDGTNWEYGVGLYTASGTTLARTPTNTNAQNTTPITLTSTAIVTAVLRAEDVPKQLAITTQTLNYTFNINDGGNWIRMNSASALTVTIPPRSSVAFPVGTSIVIEQQGTGQVTFAPGSGVTIQKAGTTLSTRTQSSVLSVTMVANDVWVLVGDNA